MRLFCTIKKKMKCIDSRIKSCILAACLVGVAGSALAGWTVTSDSELGQGTVSIISDSTVNITGPTGNLLPSIDSAAFATTYMPAGGQYTVSFHLDYVSGTDNGGLASFYWPGAPGDNPVTFAAGLGNKSDNYSFIVGNGQSIEFTLVSQTDPNKSAPTFNVSGFSVTYKVPDATPWINAALFLPLLLARRFKSVLSRS